MSGAGQGDGTDPERRQPGDHHAKFDQSLTSPIRSSPSSSCPAGKPIYFRTVTTDAFQGPNMANFYADVLKVKSVYILDDSGAYGVGMADAFQKGGG